jgi:hypothetical protein
MSQNREKQVYDSQGSGYISVSLLEREVEHVTNELRTIKEELHQLENSQNMLVPELIAPIRLKLGQLATRNYYGKFDIGGKLYDLSHNVVGNLLDECHDLVSRYLTKSDYYRVGKELRPIHDKLTHIVFALRNMMDRMDQGEDIQLQPSDLLPYRRVLGDLDGIYHDAAFDVSKDPTDHFPNYPHGEAIVCELFNEAYDLIDRLKMKTNFYRFDDSLRPIFDSMQTVLIAIEGCNQPESIISSKMYTPPLKKSNSITGLKVKTDKLWKKFKEISFANGKNSKMGIDSAESIALTATLFQKAFELFSSSNNVGKISSDTSGIATSNNTFSQSQPVH